MVLFPSSSADSSCLTLFGRPSPGSGPPLFGTGTLLLHDVAQAEYTSAYTPSSLTISVAGCAFTFAGPALGTDAVGGPVRVLRAAAGPPGGAGSECLLYPADPCGRAYRAAVAAGIFVLVDAAADAACRVLVFGVNPGSDLLEGSFGLVAAMGKAVQPERTPPGAPPSITGEYVAGGAWQVIPRDCRVILIWIVIQVSCQIAFL